MTCNLNPPLYLSASFNVRCYTQLHCFLDYVTNECLLAENLEKLGMFVLSREDEPSIGCYCTLLSQNIERNEKY